MPSNTYMTVADTLRGRIVRGQITGRLLPRAELAAQLGVGLSTIVSALKELRNEGLIESRQGDGTYVTGSGDQRSPLNRLTEHLRTVSVGDLLPSEPELADTLGLSRNTLRPAIAYLEAQGFLGRGYRRRLVVLSMPPETKPRETVTQGTEQ